MFLIKFYKSQKYVLNSHLLVFLTFRDIFNLSMTCKEMRSLIDSDGHSQHLKLLAGAHLLGSQIIEYIDDKFQQSVMYIKDFYKLDGAFFKNKVIEMFGQEPKWDKYRDDFKM